MSKSRTSKKVSKKTGSVSRAASGSEPTNKSDMKTAEIRDLIEFISKTGLNEVDIETKELKIHVKREPDQKVMKGSSVPMMTQAVASPQPVATPVQAAKVEKPVATGKKTLDIKSPMIGTFYRSSSPETAPFVSIGDKISKGQVVGIIEAMKLFNEIESEISGTIVKVMIENSSPVEYDQVLFVVEPD